MLIEMLVTPASLFLFNIITHIGLVYLLFTASILDIVLLIIMYVLMRCCGISMMYHRHYAHAAWPAPQWFKIPGTFFATLTGEGTPVSWTIWHLTHHRHSDTAKDPHSPLYLSKLRCWFMPMFGQFNVKFGARLTRDPVAMWFHKWFWLCHAGWAVSLFLLYPQGILSMYLAPAALTWALGSAQNIYSHLYGQRAHDTDDNSKNNVINAMIGFGEGWHNNHHHNPSEYRFGTESWQPDMAAWLIERMIHPNR